MRQRLHLTTFPVIALVLPLLSCASEAGVAMKPATAGNSAAEKPLVDGSSASEKASGANAAKAARGFENPGGMWMPEQMAEQTETLRSLGLEIEPKALANPMSDVLQSIVSLGGCSASFISAEGLIATNHHCAIGALQYNSSPKDNLLRDGFLAKSRTDERPNGPTSRVFVTQSLKDVTNEVREGLDTAKDDGARYKMVEARTKALVAECEKGRPEVRCSVAEYFGGGQYRLIEQLEIRDVRLVFAPHGSVGAFGGEIDNWRWPRHSGDVALYRAYVGKDGKPADFSPENVPYKAPHHLKLASKALEAGDLVLVAGYPGRTNRLKTAGETSDAVSWFYPRTIQFMEENIALLEKLTKDDAELTIKATPTVRGLNNAMTKYRGIVEGLTKGGQVVEKTKAEADLKAWIEGSEDRKKAYGDVLGKIETLLEKERKSREEEAALGEVFRMAGLVGSASTIVRMAEERPKADADREPAFQERNWTRMEQGERSSQKRYDRKLDTALLKLALKRAVKAQGKGTFPVVTAILGKGPFTDGRIDEAVDALYKGTSLEDAEARVTLLKTGKLADLKKSKDALVQLAFKLRPLQKAMEDRDHAYAGAMMQLRPRYIDALAKAGGKSIAPDANGTLRITYGTVRGYKPTADAPVYKPFTAVSEMVGKSTGKDPFDAPDVVLTAAKAKKFGPYAAKELGELPVDFLSDLDITGGNSGSATLNSRGELVGLAFDGNYESMASDWIFLPSITRTIHVDARYILWLLDGVYQGGPILKEMGATPALH